MKKYLEATYFFDYNTEEIQNQITDLKSGSLSDTEKAVACYLNVRDGWRYNAYNLYFKKEKWKASVIAKEKEAHCIDKSTLLITFLRALGIPARIHLAKVKNHIAVEKLMEKLGTNELSPHGMVDVFLNEKWVKASPAFNATLCEKCNVAPLDFDGKNDSVFQEYNRDGKEFMEYQEIYGEYEDVPLEKIKEIFNAHYPQFEKHFVDGRLDIGSLSKE